MSVLRQFVVLLLAALVLLEGSGVARAFGHTASVQCCCGNHAKARPCGCRSCPAKRGRADDASAPELSEAAPCSGGAIEDGAILQVVAEPPAPAPLLSPAPPAGALAFAALAPPSSRALDPVRPPP